MVAAGCVFASSAVKKFGFISHALHVFSVNRLVVGSAVVFSFEVLAHSVFFNVSNQLSFIVSHLFAHHLSALRIELAVAHRSPSIPVHFQSSASILTRRSVVVNNSHCSLIRVLRLVKINVHTFHQQILRVVASVSQFSITVPNVRLSRLTFQSHKVHLLRIRSTIIFSLIVAAHSLLLSLTILHCTV